MAQGYALQQTAVLGYSGLNTQGAAKSGFRFITFPWETLLHRPLRNSKELGVETESKLPIPSCQVQGRKYHVLVTVSSRDILISVVDEGHD